MGECDPGKQDEISAIAAFHETLAGKSPHTLHTYQTGLKRFLAYLEARGLPPTTPTSALPADVLERFYTWLVTEHGRANRPTCTTYLAATRASSSSRPGCARSSAAPPTRRPGSTRPCPS